MQDTNDAIRQIINDFKQLDYIKPDDIPDIALYMDQVTTFMDERLAGCRRYEDDKILTKTMINNYAKNNLIPAPEKKKYTKDHMLLFILIYYFKSFLSIGDIEKLLGPLSANYFNKEEGYDVEDFYRTVYKLVRSQISSISKNLIADYNKTDLPFPGVPEEDTEYFRQLAYICELSFDVYVKKQLIERLIDRMPEAPKGHEGKTKK